MRRFPIIILIASIVLQQGCQIRSSSPRRTAALLDDVESYINERPDSALTVLRSLDSNAVRGPALRARAALLHQIALDKCYIDICNDSILSPAFWYLRHGTPDQKLKIWYYRGVLAGNAGDIDEQMSCLVRAERLIPRANDPLMAGFVYSAKRGLYLTLYDIDNATVNAWKAVAAFRGTDERPRYFNAIIGLANLTNLQGDYSTSEALLDTLRKHWDVLSSRQRRLYYGIELSYHISTDEGEKGTLSEFIEHYLTEVPYSSVNWETVARAYYQDNQPEKALTMIERSGSSRTPAEEIAYQNTRYKILESLGREEEALETYRTYTRLVDERTTIGLFSKGRFAEIEEELRQKEKKETRMILFLVAGLVLLGGASIIGLRLANKKILVQNKDTAALQKQLAENGNQINTLENKARRAQKEVSRLKELLKEDNLPDGVLNLIRERVFLLNEYGVRILSGQKVQASTILHDRLQLDDKQRFVDDLCDQIECLYPGVASLFTQRKLNRQEKECFSLLCLGLSIRDIARFMDLSEKRCYNIRSSIRHKLRIEKDTRPLDQIIQELYSGKKQ